MRKIYAVMGYPISHSKSPIIHAAFARQFNIDLRYEKIAVESGNLAPALLAFQSRGGNGVNITSPLKNEAYQITPELTKRATIAKAVNTVVFLAEGKWHGDNTDGIGLLHDLVNNHQLVIKDKQIAIIGAGGASRGILATLLTEQPACIIIANRSLETAVTLVSEFSPWGNLKCGRFQDLAHQTFDLVINATSASTKGENLQLPSSLADGAVCYDLAYGNHAKPFLDWAQNHGATQCLDGLGMLLEQAAESFYLWHGKKPNTHPVIEMFLHAEHNNGEI